jgi:hypothetical protein
MLEHRLGTDSPADTSTDMYFSADVETDGPIPGPFSLLSFALVRAGTFDGENYTRERGTSRHHFYCELKPISDQFQTQALEVNGLDRMRLQREGLEPAIAMSRAASWIKVTAGECRPVLVAYPLSFDWSWLYWYFTMFSNDGSPFSYSQCFDLKTAYAIKAHRTISQSSRSKLLPQLQARSLHTHNALDDAIEQAEIFANVFEWSGTVDR